MGPCRLALSECQDRPPCREEESWRFRSERGCSVHFALGTAWHTYLNSQTIYVLEGVALCQRRGGPIDYPAW
jgi:hypothetical protein